jgi:hypothetical protein
MLRLLYNITSSKALLQEVFNCWLAYATSQPVNFDLKIIIIFACHYFGVMQMWMLVRSAINRFTLESGYEDSSGTNQESDNMLMNEQMC